MSEHDNRGIREMLAQAVPPLRGPDDRMRDVGMRVRRRQRALAASATFAAAVTVILGLTVPRLATGAVEREPDAAPVTRTPIGSWQCPEAMPSGVGEFDGRKVFEDQQQFAVPHGAAEVILCDVPTGTSEVTPVPPRVLTGDVNLVLDTLNADVPPPPTAIPPGTKTVPSETTNPSSRLAWGCRTGPRLATERAFVLRYPDREPVTVLSSQPCSLIYLPTGQARPYRESRSTPSCGSTATDCGGPPPRRFPARPASRRCRPRGCATEPVTRCTSIKPRVSLACRAGCWR